MRRLVIDTSGQNCSIAIVENSDVVAERHEPLGRGHAERLIPWIAELCQGAHADEIIVGCGPGSFTGVRIGIAAGRGLALGWGISVFGISSFELITAGRNEIGLTVAVSAGHGELFVQNFKGAPLSAEGALHSLSPSDAAGFARFDLVVGSGAKILVEARGWGAASSGDPHASRARFFSPKRPFSTASPIYGRSPDARRLIQ